MTHILLPHQPEAASSETPNSQSALPVDLATPHAPARVKVGFVSLGCPKNLVDSEVMMGLLHKAGAEMTSSPENADVLVVNTCSFIDSAKQESVDTILEMAQHKANGAGRRLIVAGCLVERYRDEIRKNIPEVDAVVGTGELDQILAAAGLDGKHVPANPGVADSPFRILGGGPAASVEARSSQPEPSQSSRAEGDLRESQGRFARTEWDGAAPALPQYLYDDTTPRLLATPRSSAYIKIAEGCDHPCSFCVIPNLRGKFRSRRFESVVLRPSAWWPREFASSRSSGRTRPATARISDMKDGLALLLDASPALTDSSGCASSTPIPNKITRRCLRPWRSTTTSASTSTYRCSMPRPRC